MSEQLERLQAEQRKLATELEILRSVQAVALSPGGPLIATMLTNWLERTKERMTNLDVGPKLEGEYREEKAVKNWISDRRQEFKTIDAQVKRKEDALKAKIKEIESQVKREQEAEKASFV